MHFETCSSLNKALLRWYGTKNLMKKYTVIGLELTYDSTTMHVSIWLLTGQNLPQDNTK